MKKNLFIIFFAIILVVSNVYALTKDDIFKTSEINNTNLSCFYYASETRLGIFRSDASIRWVKFKKQLDAYTKKRDLYIERFNNAKCERLRKIYKKKFQKFKKIVSQIKQCKNFNTATLACDIFDRSKINTKVINGARCQSPQKSLVAKVLIYSNSGKEGICSATYIAPRMFLSAAHCFEDFDAINRVELKFAGKTYNAVSLYINNQYDQSNEKGDVALINISEDLNITPFKLVKRNYQAKKGDLVAMLGHGITSYSPYRTGFHGGFATISLVTDSGIKISYNKKFGEANTCNGDSGGPLVVYEDGAWRILGVTSCGDDQYCGYFSGTEHSWWSKINSSENIQFLEENIPGIFD